MMADQENSCGVTYPCLPKNPKTPEAEGGSGPAWMVLSLISLIALLALGVIAVLDHVPCSPLHVVRRVGTTAGARPDVSNHETGAFACRTAIRGAGIGLPERGFLGVLANGSSHSRKKAAPATGRRSTGWSTQEWSCAQLRPACLGRTQCVGSGGSSFSLI